MVAASASVARVLSMLILLSVLVERSDDWISLFHGDKLYFKYSVHVDFMTFKPLS